MKTNIIILLVVVAIVGYLIYSKFIKKTATGSSDISSLFAKKDIATATVNADGTTTNSIATNIAIKNATLAASPLMGQLHLIATVQITAPPSSGVLQILQGSKEIESINLPIVGNIYELNAYIEVSDVNATVNLTAKIGNISKTISVKA